MAGKHTALFGIFPSRPDVERAVNALRAEGYRNTDISVLFPVNGGNRDTGREQGKSSEGARSGAVSGAGVGGALGWLAGIGSLAIPGLGPFVAAGPIMAALAGVRAGRSVGGIGGALSGMGIPEQAAQSYEGRVKSGEILLSVHCDDARWTNKAEEILQQMGVEDMSSTGLTSPAAGPSDRPQRRTGT